MAAQFDSKKHGAGRGPSVASLLRIHPRFLRSVFLERDIDDPESSLGYVLTPTSADVLERLSASLNPSSTQRAWRLAGDYGSGKTDLALAVARIVAGDTRALPPALQRFIGKQRLTPHLATGSSEPLGVTVLRALGKASNSAQPSIDEVVAAIKEAVADARKAGRDGILLTIDELGKNLEHAARNPEADDIFLLQRLAEEAARSSKNIFVVTVILHQGIMSYAEGLDTAAKREWSKVAGRFEEISFANPVEQTATLLHSTLGVTTDKLPPKLSQASVSAMRTAISMGLYGPSGAASLTDLAPGLFPLHPTTIPVLLTLVRRFGQNERSLFGFMSSAEPMALQHHAKQQIAEADHYRVSDLFDYTRQNLSSSIHGTSAHTRWGIIETIVTSAAKATPVEDDVLKTVAILNLVDSSDLVATEAFIALAVAGGHGPNNQEVSAAIAKLRKQGMLYERGASSGLCLWQHTSVDIEAAFNRSLKATEQRDSGIAALCAHLSLEPLVPRGYYVETGTLRHASVEVRPAVDVEGQILNHPGIQTKGADLQLCLLAPSDKRQMREAKHLIFKNIAAIPAGIIFGVVEPPVHAIKALHDLVAWRYVEQNTPELSGDKFAREEVSRQVKEAEYRLHSKLEGLTGLATNGGGKLPLFYKNETITVRPGRELLTFLGEQCRLIYPKCPEIKNELINRRAPSSAAVAARTKLAEAMATSSHLPFLGMDESKRPPEMALYISIIQKGNFHWDQEDKWVFQIPTRAKDTLKLLPSLEKITELLKAAGDDTQVDVPQIFDTLRRPPFGVRDGVLPVVLSIYLAANHQRVALYEDSTYLHQVGGDHFMRLMKEPQAFALQYCGLDGVRADVLPQLLQHLRLSPKDANAEDLLDLVRPLAVFVGREIPDYARKTNALSATAVAIRKALLEAREPIKLVFTILPQACGIPAITPTSPWTEEQSKEFALKIANALHEIRAAYTTLVERLGKAICAAFDGNHGPTKDRLAITGRAVQLATQVTEPALKAFAVRLGDGGLSDKSWIESVGNLLAKKSPERWGDVDEIEFYHQLELLSGRFRRVEAALFHGAKVKLNGHACRIALTKTDGTEVNDLVRWDDIPEDTIQKVQKELDALITRNGRQGVAAAMRVLWQRLSEPVTEVKKS